MLSLETKQVIVCRTDLNMRKGKIGAQVAHASMAALLAQFSKSTLRRGDVMYTCLVEANTALFDWLEGSFTKIVVGIDSEQGLLDIHAKAKELGAITSLTQDAGRTEFGGVPTYTCCAVGPDKAELVNSITGHLKLL